MQAKWPVWVNISRRADRPEDGRAAHGGAIPPCRLARRLDAGQDAHTRRHAAPASPARSITAEAVGGASARHRFSTYLELSHMHPLTRNGRTRERGKNRLGKRETEKFVGRIDSALGVPSRLLRFRHAVTCLIVCVRTYVFWAGVETLLSLKSNFVR